MRRFLFKSTVFLVGLWLLLIGFGSLADDVAPMNIWRTGTQQEYASLLRRRRHIRAISLGNSHSGAIDFDVLGVEGQVLSGNGMDLFEMNRYAASVVTRLPELQTAFLAVSYFSFNRDNLTLDDTRILRIERYAMLPTWMPVAGDWQYVLLGKLHAVSSLMSVVRPDSWQRVVRRALAPARAEGAPQYHTVRTVTPWGECAYFPSSQLDAIAREIAGKHVARHQTMSILHRGLEDDTYRVLGKAIDYLRRRGARVILFTPPYYETYTATFATRGRAMLDHMRQAMRRLQRDYQVDYFDFSRDPELSTRPELFENSDHLNDCGRKAFTARLLNAMQGSSYSTTGMRNALDTRLRQSRTN